MFSTDDTIVATATPRGRSAIGVVRLSGPKATVIAVKLLGRDTTFKPRHATLGRIGGSKSTTTAADEVIATYFPAPHSYTGQALVEISGHGNPVLLDAIVEEAVAVGARMAEPGEFTLRAFLNDKCDLVQAEAVADLIDAVTPLQARTAFDQLEGTLTKRISTIDAGLFDLIARFEASLDFPDEGYHFIEPSVALDTVREVIRQVDLLLIDGVRGRVIREGARVVIAGRPNTGKSSLFNRLHGSDRTIVTDVPGTTRDLVTEQIDLEGLAVDLVDTAGWRATLDLVEREGVARGEQARATADLTLVVLDTSEALTGEDRELLAATAKTTRVVIANKADLPLVANVADDVARVSAKTGDGISELRSLMLRVLSGRESLHDPAAVSNSRHLKLMRSARVSLETVCDALTAGWVSEEFVLVDLQAARACFDEIVGRRTTDDLIRHIFERFCIGK
jgi:tRNA modification GTPase